MNLPLKNKFNFLQHSGTKDQIQRALNKIAPKSYPEENWSQGFYATTGMWLFPAIVATLSTFGLGEIFSSFLPSWLGYFIACILVLLIEFAQAAFGRPLMKRVVRKQTISLGMISRVIGFTLLSIGISAVSFYMVILETDTNTFAENKLKLSVNTDSLTKSYSSKKNIVLKQLNSLLADKPERFHGLLMPEEQALQANLNQQLIANDSMQKAELVYLEKKYPSQVTSTNWKFSPDKLFKILGSVFFVLLLGFLTIYSHYLDFKHALGVENEMNNLLNLDGEITINEEVSIQRITNEYYQTAINIPGYMEYFGLPAAVENKNLPPILAHPIHNQNTQPAKHATPKSEIGFYAIKKKQNEAKQINHETIEKTKESANNEARAEFMHEPRANLEKGNKLCEFCGKPFMYKNMIHRFCSKNCKISAWEIRKNKKSNWRTHP